MEILIMHVVVVGNADVFCFVCC